MPLADVEEHIGLTLAHLPVPVLGQPGLPAPGDRRREGQGGAALAQLAGLQHDLAAHVQSQNVLQIVARALRHAPDLLQNLRVIVPDRLQKSPGVAPGRRPGDVGIVLKHEAVAPHTHVQLFPGQTAVLPADLAGRPRQLQDRKSDLLLHSASSFISIIFIKCMDNATCLVYIFITLCAKHFPV